MRTEVSFNQDKGMFAVKVYYSFESLKEIKEAASKALRAANVPECVTSYLLYDYQMTRYEADPLIADYFQRAGLKFSTRDVNRMDWGSINELIRFIRSGAVVVAI